MKFRKKIEVDTEIEVSAKRKDCCSYNCDHLRRACGLICDLYRANLRKEHANSWHIKRCKQCVEEFLELTK